MFVAPRYGSGSLADLFPSLLASLGVPGERDRLGLGSARRVCVLLVDGLGAEALAAHPDEAPFLSGLTPEVITAGFPTTTATSLSSLGVGVPPGEHGVVGYLLNVPGYERMFSPLAWKMHGDSRDLRSQLVPEQFQPTPTVFERAAADGVAVATVAPRYQDGSGLTRAVLRGSEFLPNFSGGDLVAEVARALRAGERSLVYTYHGDLDMTGHVRGPNSPAWGLELAHVDLMVREIAERLPEDALLVVTADHGMVELTERVDFDDIAELRAGVAQLGGEPRARHVYAEAGAAADVAAAWRESLGSRFEVLARDAAIANGWFGPKVAGHVVDSIGDVVVVARGSAGVIRSGVEPLQSGLIGHHGSLTSAEMLVPLRTYRS
ncbi:alkaline phosphatase family protein [Nocardia panacis]|uniref:Alkaline phosphatase family protein n=1 Tax=Nocardia panacis TaxID=2340916 RepID=A0A3A4L6E7_9NOCA|nr:alkaline phosphatase family protein [Nocardia panacis]RJO78336.1 alkaline phosphatase family protein [Nocardia panacis]